MNCLSKLFKKCPSEGKNMYAIDDCPPERDRPKLFIQAVIVSINFGDILAWTLPQNKQVLDEIVVVTSPEDTLTQKICEHYHVRCIKTEAYKLPGGAGKFNKAECINVGLAALSKQEWVVQMDADILLPPRTHEMLEKAEPLPDTIYGCDRVNVPSFDAYIKYHSNPVLQLLNQAFLVMNEFPNGARLIRGNGYVPIGYFQLWNPKGSGVFTYSVKHDEMNSHCDVSHAETWPRNKRGFIPEFIAMHLMSEDEGHGTNWEGRISKPFVLEEKDVVKN